MEYFVSHIGIIIVAAVIIAVIGFVMVVVAGKNESNRDINEESCNFSCGDCINSVSCSKPEKKK